MTYEEMVVGNLYSGNFDLGGRQKKGNFMLLNKTNKPIDGKLVITIMVITPHKLLDTLPTFAPTEWSMFYWKDELEFNRAYKNKRKCFATLSSITSLSSSAITQ